MKTNCDPDRLLHQSFVDDYAWRFELIRSTLEDFEQLIADEQPLPPRGECSGRRSGATPREIPMPTLTLPRLRLAAMTA